MTYFYSIFLCPCLSTTKLSCLQKNNFGHTSIHTCANNRKDYYIDRRASKLPHYNINYVAITIRKSLSIVAKIAFFYDLFSDSTKNRNGILLSILFWPTVRKNCCSDREKPLELEAESREFSKVLRSVEQFIQTVNNFW